MLHNNWRKMGIHFLVESVPLAAGFSYHCRYIEVPGLRIPDDKKNTKVFLVAEIDNLGLCQFFSNTLSFS